MSNYAEAKATKPSSIPNPTFINMAKPIKHREKIFQYLAILKVKMTEDDLDAFLKKASPIRVGVSELLAPFLVSLPQPAAVPS